MYTFSPKYEERHGVDHRKGGSGDGDGPIGCISRSHR